MAKLFLTTAVAMFAFASNSAWASCVGSDYFKTCTDQSGNNYTVSRMGNTTQVQGSNLNTGNNWSQTSNTIGNMTITNGQAADGNYWNQTTTRIGDQTITNGTDSRGNPYTVICNQFGCN